jgi:hypothetical protein
VPSTTAALGEGTALAPEPVGETRQAAATRGSKTSRSGLGDGPLGTLDLIEQ